MSLLFEFGCGFIKHAFVKDNGLHKKKLYKNCKSWKARDREICTYTPYGIMIR